MEQGDLFWKPRTECEVGSADGLNVEYLYPGIRLYANVDMLSYCWAIVKNYSEVSLKPFNRHFFTVTSKVTDSYVTTDLYGYLSSGVGAWIYTSTPYTIQLSDRTIQSNRIELFFPTHYRSGAIWPGPAPQPGGLDWHWIIFHSDFMVFCYFLANQPEGVTSTVNMTPETFEVLMRKIAAGVETKGISFSQWARIVDVDLKDSKLYIPYLYVEGAGGTRIKTEFYNFQYYYKEGTVWEEALSPPATINVV